MSNFSPKLEESTEEQLNYSINEHDPRFSVLSSNELTRRALNNLEKTIKTFNEKTSKETKVMLFLTYFIAFLTAIMVIGLGIQLYLALS